MNILLIGSGGREHALAWKISQSEFINKLYIAPGNAGTSNCGVNVDIDISDFEQIKDFSIKENIQMIVVGPELPLVNGLVDFFKKNHDISHIQIIGPSKAGANLEGSKMFAKEFMLRHNIPSAAFRTFTLKTLAEGITYINNTHPPYVIKANGLASGKGVVISNDALDAIEQLKQMLKGSKFGEASETVVIEEFMKGIELSVFVVTDGKSYIILPEAKDYKRIGEGDTGPNTGGMGAVSPVSFADKTFMDKIEKRIIKPTIAGLKEEHIDYKGFIFIGIMNCDGEPFVVEYNCRLGDPETQVILPRIENDLIELFERIASQSLHDFNLSVSPSNAASIILASGGYPENYDINFPIEGLEKVTQSLVFHSGTKLLSNNQIITQGGRVLTVTSSADTLQQALDISYYSIKHISFTSKQFRKDIGKDLL